MRPAQKRGDPASPLLASEFVVRFSPHSNSRLASRFLPLPTLTRPLPSGLTPPHSPRPSRLAHFMEERGACRGYLQVRVRLPYIEPLISAFSRAAASVMKPNACLPNCRSMPDAAGLACTPALDGERGHLD